MVGPLRTQSRAQEEPPRGQGEGGGRLGKRRQVSNNDAFRLLCFPPGSGILGPQVTYVKRHSFRLSHGKKCETGPSNVFIPAHRGELVVC